MLRDTETERERRPPGQRPSPRARRAWTPLTRALAATGDHWTLLIALTLSPGRMRVTQLQRCLPGVSAGVLERYLQQMISLGLVTRTRFKEMPPRVELELTDAGRELLPVAGALTRWGARHLWSAPREREQVDLGALLGLLPMLLGDNEALPEGSLEAFVEGTDPPVSRRYRVLDGRLTLDDDGAQDISAGVHGDSDSWIAALGPSGDRAGLSFSGDTALGTQVFDALGGQCGPGLAQWPRDQHG